ncbi:MAG TPA: LytTR family transcriptional regulator DNA-binding domain-containing protein [Chitinophagaceae bacterium]|jgi:two-component system LytT family response regulator|nr:LytTR family transcriptional regulator DNA-binding domain-containing protein [Chitinophagaceae bacterium]
MIKAIIIDDEPLARLIIREYLQDYRDIEIVEECNDGFEGVKAIQEHEPGLVFLDIQMPKINGFEMLQLIEEPPAIIFTTAFDEYAIKAFDLHAVDYLLKPFSKERFGKAIDKWLAQRGTANGNAATKALIQDDALIPGQAERIVIKTGGKIKIIPVSEIKFLEAADDYVKIHTKDGTFLKNKTLSYFEQVLATKSFVRTHRSYMVNIQEINRIDPFEKDSHVAFLKDGVRIPVSKSGYAKLRAMLGI